MRRERFEGWRVVLEYKGIKEREEELDRSKVSRLGLFIVIDSIFAFILMAVRRN